MLMKRLLPLRPLFVIEHYILHSYILNSKPLTIVPSPNLSLLLYRTGFQMYAQVI